MSLFVDKEAMSVSFPPCNQSQILQYVKYAKILTLHNKLQNFVTNNVFLDKKVKTQQQQNTH